MSGWDTAQKISRLAGKFFPPAGLLDTGIGAVRGVQGVVDKVRGVNDGLSAYEDSLMKPTNPTSPMTKPTTSSQTPSTGTSSTSTPTTGKASTGDGSTLPITPTQSNNSYYIPDYSNLVAPQNFTSIAPDFQTSDAYMPDASRSSYSYQASTGWPSPQQIIDQGGDPNAFYGSMFPNYNYDPNSDYSKLVGDNPYGQYGGSEVGANVNAASNNNNMIGDILQKYTTTPLPPVSPIGSGDNTDSITQRPDDVVSLEAQKASNNGTMTGGAAATQLGGKLSTLPLNSDAVSMQTGQTNPTATDTMGSKLVEQLRGAQTTQREDQANMLAAQGITGGQAASQLAKGDRNFGLGMSQGLGDFNINRLNQAAGINRDFLQLELQRELGLGNLELGSSSLDAQIALKLSEMAQNGDDKTRAEIMNLMNQYFGGTA